MGISASLWSIFAYSQAVIESEREPIVVFDEAGLNPVETSYTREGSTGLKNIRVIDGTGANPVEGQDLLVTDGIIAAVGPTGSLYVPADAKIIDGEGLTVLPGLIDAHNSPV